MYTGIPSKCGTLGQCWFIVVPASQSYVKLILVQRPCLHVSTQLLSKPDALLHFLTNFNCLKQHFSSSIKARTLSIDYPIIVKW